MKKIWLMTAALACATAIGGPAMSQPAAEQPQARETVEVFAPYVVRREAAKPPRGMNREYLSVISVDRAVSFHDLDLKKAEDQATLESRVKQAATDACGQLEHRFPKSTYIPVPEHQDCVKNATDEAMIQVNALIMAANAS